MLASAATKMGEVSFKKAVDETKDQSYVLYSMTQDELAHTLFPLGELTKSRWREIAAKIGFSNAKKQESQDICFAPDGNYAAAIEALYRQDIPAGAIYKQRRQISWRK